MVFKSLLVRELKAFLKNPAFIISMIFVLSFYTFMGRVIATGVESAVKEVERASIGIVVEDQSKLLSETLRVLNKTYSLKLYSSHLDGLRESTILIVFPKGFTENITSNGTVGLRAYVSISSLNTVSYQARIGLIQRFVESLRESISLAYSSLYNVTIPYGFSIRTRNSVVFYEKVFDERVFNIIASVSSLIPFIIGFAMGINASYSSQLTAVEKDEKAFEMLLAQPIHRRDIVLAKIIASIAASLINGLVIFTGLFLMGFAQVSTAAPAVAQAEGNGVEVVDTSSIPMTSIAGVSIVSLVIGLIYSGAVGVIVGSIVSDTRSAGTLSAPLIFVFMGFALVSLFTGLPVSEATSIVYGALVIPLAYLYVYSVLTGKMIYFALGLASSILVCVSLVMLAVRLFEQDIVVTGLKFGFRKSRTISP